jgi:hypothetical protein
MPVAAGEPAVVPLLSALLAKCWLMIPKYMVDSSSSRPTSST